jgi:hypothetical protein
MIPRHLAGRVRAALADTPVVLLQGARQVGKSTLARAIAAGGRRRYLTLDDQATLAAARADPAGFVAGLEGPVVLDEVQRAPELLLAIKVAVDRARRPGRFLLTGSANVLFLPAVADALAGRMEPLTLRPLSQGELEGRREGFVDAAFADGAPALRASPASRLDMIARVCRGGFPEVVARRKAERRSAWFDAYLATVLGRDVREYSRIEDLTALPRLLATLAARSAGLLNVAGVGRDLGIPASTLARHFAILERGFLVEPLPAWSGSLGRRLVKAPKLHLTDTGVLAHLLGVAEGRLVTEPELLGTALETFVAAELGKQLAWSRTRAGLFHFRAHTGQEVDLLLEDRAGRLVGIEVKASSTVASRDLAGLRLLATERARRFHRGIVLYLGAEVVPFGERLHAMPVSALWQWGAVAAPAR